jgi:CspA family cold shock protein
MARGVVKWHKVEKGFGAISSAELPPGRDAWFHSSVVEGSSMELLPGVEVEFGVEAVKQDSFDYRATWVRLARDAHDAG